MSYVDSMMRYWDQSRAYDMRDTLKLWKESAKQGNDNWRAYKEVVDRISQEPKTYDTN